MDKPGLKSAVELGLPTNSPSSQECVTHRGLGKGEMLPWDNSPFNKGCCNIPSAHKCLLIPLYLTSPFQANIPSVRETLLVYFSGSLFD